MDGDQFDPAAGGVPPGVLPALMPPAIAAAIVAVKKQVKQLGVDDKNEHGRYNFVSVDKFYERIGRLMAEAGLALLIDETATDVRAAEKSGNPWLFARYDLVFMHESGAMSHPLRRSIALAISGPQAFGAAQSYIEKQFLRQVFKVPTGEKDADDSPTDGDAPKSPNAARTAQGSPPAGKMYPKRPEAAPARSPGQEKAIARYKELAGTISVAGTIAELEEIDASLSDDLALMAAMPEETTALVGQLHDKIEGQKKYLYGATG